MTRIAVYIVGGIVLVTLTAIVVVAGWLLNGRDD